MEIGQLQTFLAVLDHGGFSRASIDENVRTGRLTLVRVPGLPIRRSFQSAVLRGSTLSAAARAFLSLVHRGRD